MAEPAIPKLTVDCVISDPQRDPRGHTVSIAFFASASLDTLKAGDDAASAEMVKDWRKEKLAFDHAQILEDAFRKFPQP